VPTSGPPPAQAKRRVEQGISLADFLQAFRIGQFTLWQGVLEAVGDDPEARDAALSVVAQLMHLIEVGSTLAAEAYLEAQQYRLAENDRVRRDLLEDLLARRDPSAGPRQATLRGVGLQPDTSLLVVSAAAITPLENDHGLREAAATLQRRSRNRGAPGLAVVRQDEIVAVVPVPRIGAGAIVTHLGRARADLQRRQVRLAVGVSTVYAGIREVPEAYAEAYGARSALGGTPGMVTLPQLSSFDHLTLREDETARRIIAPEVRRFVEEDIAAGSGLVDTLVECAACDLNAKTAARRLHLHANTAYYPPHRIAEKTGCDVRRFSDVIELLIAIRLLRAAPPQTS
jgi:sugar diacid utilization regulator